MNDQADTSVAPLTSEEEARLREYLSSRRYGEAIPATTGKRLIATLDAARAGRDGLREAARREAYEIVRARLHLVLPNDKSKRDHASDLNAECNSLARWIVDDVRAALADPAPGGERYVLEYDEQERWLVMSDPEGASQIIARDVRPEDAPYLIAGYNRLAAPEDRAEGLDVERLAKAYHKTCCRLGSPGPGLQKGNGVALHSCPYRDAHRKSMTALAAEYARLTPDRTPTEEAE